MHERNHGMIGSFGATVLIDTALLTADSSLIDIT